MMQLLLNIPARLHERVMPLASATNETAEQSIHD